MREGFEDFVSFVSVFPFFVCKMTHQVWNAVRLAKKRVGERSESESEREGNERAREREGGRGRGQKRNSAFFSVEGEESTTLLLTQINSPSHSSALLTEIDPQQLIAATRFCLTSTESGATAEAARFWDRS